MSDTEHAASPPVWYARSGGELIGPMPTHALERLIAERTLRKHDTVRLGNSGDWLSVADVQRMFAVEDAPHGASQAARDALARAARAQLETDGSDDFAHVLRRPRRSHVNALGVLGDFFAATIGRAAGWLLSQIVRFLRFRPVRWAATLGAIAIAGAAAYWFIVVPRLPLSGETVLAEYRLLWGDVEAAQKRDADGDDWSELTRRAHLLVFHYELPLRHHATSQEPVLQELLWATPHLSAAVGDARDGRSDKSQALAKFRIHLDNAERHAVREAEVEEKLPAAARSPAASMTGEAGIDALLVGFLVFDGLVVLAVGWYVLRPAMRQ